MFDHYLVCIIYIFREVTYPKLPKKIESWCPTFPLIPHLINRWTLKTLMPFLQVTSDPDSIMNNSPTHYEMKQESSQVHWHSKKDWTQEVALSSLAKLVPVLDLDCMVIIWLICQFIYFLFFIIIIFCCKFYFLLIIDWRPQTKKCTNQTIEIEVCIWFSPNPLWQTA